MKISDAFPSNYLKSSDLQGRSVRVQIDKVQTEELGRDREMKPILYFQGKSKGMVLNRTNGMVIAAAYGDDTDSWRGAEIELYVAIVEMGGKQMDGLRVRIPARQAVRQPVPPQEPPPRTAAPDSSDVPF